MRLLGKLSAVAFVLSLMLCGLSNAQQDPKRVGILINGGPSPLFDSIKKNLLSDFAELGYVEGRDVVIEPRFAELKLERLPSLASQLANANVDVIVTLGAPAAVAAQKSPRGRRVVGKRWCYRYDRW